MDNKPTDLLDGTEAAEYQHRRHSLPYPPLSTHATGQQKGSVEQQQQR
jgi:hypothetical protein